MITRVLLWMSRGLVLCSLVAVIVGFWFPWAYFSFRQPALAQVFGNTSGEESLRQLAPGLGRVTLKIRRHGQTIVSDVPSLNDLPKQISGADLPRLVREQKTQVALALLEFITGKPQDVERNVWAVYLIPGIALGFGMLLLIWSRRRSITVLVGLLSAAMAGGGFWKLLTFTSSSRFVTTTIGPGLWMSIAAYVGLSIASCFAFVIAGSVCASPPHRVD